MSEMRASIAPQNWQKSDTASVPGTPSTHTVSVAGSAEAAPGPPPPGEPEAATAASLCDGRYRWTTPDTRSTRGLPLKKGSACVSPAAHAAGRGVSASPAVSRDGWTMRTLSADMAPRPAAMPTGSFGRARENESTMLDARASFSLVLSFVRDWVCVTV